MDIKKKTRILTECAVLLSIATVLSFVVMFPTFPSLPTIQPVSGHKLNPEAISPWPDKNALTCLSGPKDVQFVTNGRCQGQRLDWCGGREA